MNSLIYKIILGWLLLLMVGFISGCSDSEAEIKNKQLDRQLIQFKIANKNLILSQSKKEKTIEKLNLQLSTVKDNNTEIKVSLAKAKQLFAEENKEQIENERNELKNERKKIEIEIRDTYKGYVIIFLAFITLVGVFLFFNKRRNDKLTSEKDKKIEKLEKLNDDNKKKELEFEKEMSNLNRDVLELNKKIKEGEKSQVVSKIEECENRRDKQLKRIGVENG